MKKRMNLLLSIIITMGLFSCTKYLDIKSDKTLAVPDKLADLQAMMDNYSSLNVSGGGSSEASSDNYYLTYASWTGLSQENYRRLYTWEKDNVFAINSSSNEWYYDYQAVGFTNTVLDNLSKINPALAADSLQWNNLKGTALFFRSRAFLNLLSVWALAYDEKTAATDLGIPLRLSANFNETSVRASVEQSYHQVLQDLKASIPYLPANTITPMRPVKAAAYGVLARAYLQMRRYTEAGLYADSCLQVNSRLLDYNSLSSTASYPISQFNTEVVWEGHMQSPSLISMSNAKIDSSLYLSYEATDLRKVIYFKSNNDGTYAFKGSYDGSSSLFNGVTTDEMYLTRAESRVRGSNTTGAVSDLNSLLLKRYKTGTYTNYAETDAAKVLQKILTERRKELVMRDLRWMDIKRLNKEGYTITLKRILNGITYELPPNDLRYALAIPEDVIALSGMQPNPR